MLFTKTSCESSSSAESPALRSILLVFWFLPRVRTCYRNYRYRILIPKGKTLIGRSIESNTHLQ